MMEFSFRVHRKAWKVGAKIEALGITLVPSKDNNEHCLVKDQNGSILAVLKVEAYKKMQICTFAPSSTKKASVGEYEGTPIYEQARVYEKEDRYCHTLSVLGETYQMKRCGSSNGPKDVVVMRDGLVCAFFTEEPKKIQGGRVAPGVDPVLMLAFAVCSNKLRDLFEEMLTRKSGVTSTKTSNLF